MEEIIAKVTPEELRFAMATGTAAASGRTPESGVAAYGLKVEDTPENRAMVAIAAQFDSGKFKALMTRIGGNDDGAAGRPGQALYPAVDCGPSGR